MGGKSKSNKSNNKQKMHASSSGPLVPPPHRMLPSRKRARKMTTDFHNLLKQQQIAEKKAGESTDNESLQQVQEQIDASRADYQRASQVSTAFHSTSKWVIGALAQNGWLYGRKVNDKEEGSSETSAQEKKKRKKKQKRRRRPTKLLEIGAINTELLDAATVVTESSNGTKQNRNESSGDNSSGDVEYDKDPVDTNDSDQDDATTPNAATTSQIESINKWTKLTRIRRGKKYRNDFAIVLAPTKDGDDDESKPKNEI
mmetsp:Transcript_8960/g.24842  ORF Transcript_8960/g.24842 Transcript_8960/m.24842 type:complete len:257 (+) Transcript_8960:115-885(+)